MKVALVGNQNSGKTLLFNHLTGMNQKVGNWAGVTVERKEGTIKRTDISVIDLPGVYSLSPYTAEEEVSRNFIVTEDPDILVNMNNTTNMTMTTIIRNRENIYVPRNFFIMYLSSRCNLKILNKFIAYSFCHVNPPVL